MVPAQYAFVIHTRNPSTGDPDEIYCELVRGLGEAIVSGTVPGTALAFVARKDDLDNPQVGVGWVRETAGGRVRWVVAHLLSVHAFVCALGARGCFGRTVQVGASVRVSSAWNE